MTNVLAALGALADPTRRTVFERIAEQPRSVGELAGLVPVSRPAVSQHLAVLKAAGLVADRPVGTRRIYHIDPHGLGQVRAWLDRFWTDALLAFEAEIDSKGGTTGMTMTTIAPAPVRKAVRVRADRARAFSVFTASMTRWWPKSHSTNTSPIAEVIVEPRVGGRWFERGEDGSEREWGRVLVWEPPLRLVLAWQLDSNWSYDPGFETEVEVNFTEDGPGATRVELEHRRLERFAEMAERIRGSLDSPDGWGGIMEGFRAVVDAG